MALVDPMIGTLGSGFVFPGPAAPYGMVQLSPDTEGYFAYTGYQHADQFIRGFSHVHVQSMGVPEGGNVPFMPTVGPVLSTDVKRYQSKFSHASEAAEPGYYSVRLDTYGVLAELTAGTRVGMHRYTFPPTSEANVLLDIGRQVPGGDLDEGQRAAGRNLARIEFLDERTIAGTANLDRAAPHRYAVHFVARFDRDMISHGVWAARGDAVSDGVDVVEGVGAGAVARFDASSDPDVIAKVGISFVSVQNALENLEAELPGEDFDFDAQRARTTDAWREALGVIRVEGGTPFEQTSFYTALYHAQHHPNVYNDANGDYLGHDQQVHRIGEPGDPMPPGSTYYANFSMWDTYRAEMPLLMLIAPDRMRDMMRSLAGIVRWGGVMPRWALMNTNPNYMNGEPALQVIADAHCRGLVPPDVLDELYAEARRVALVDRRDPDYLERGWTTEASKTLEHAIGDFALALMADSLGEEGDRDTLLAGSANWREVFDTEIGFARPRNADGSWLEPYDPMLNEGFREGTGWQYSFLVPHDVAGLIDAMGGNDAAVEKLDTFFSRPLTELAPYVIPEVQQKVTLYGIDYYGNQYAPSNEHDLQAPWLYPWTAEPWKGQSIARGYQALYRAAPDGLPGNDDLGTMSAWFVWSALGFYPMIPGAPLYVIGSPLFERATIELPGGAFTVEAPGANLLAKYVTGVSLDDQPADRLWFDHDLLAPGGSIRFDMASLADPSFGVGNPPPSASSAPLTAFACSP